MKQDKEKAALDEHQDGQVDGGSKHRFGSLSNPQIRKAWQAD